MKKRTRVTRARGGRGRSGRDVGRAALRSTRDTPAYHTYLMGKRGTLFITIEIPRNEHEPFFEIFEECWDAGGGQVKISGSDRGLLILNVYRESNTAYLETEEQFKHVLAHLANRNN